MDRTLNIVKNGKGQTIVEFALIVTLLLALIFGIMEFARAWQYSNALTNGVRDGARYATLNNITSVEKIKAYTFGKITSAIPRATMTLDSIYVTPPYNNTSTITVFANYDIYILTGSIIPYFSGGRVMSRQATMKR